MMGCQLLSARTLNLPARPDALLFGRGTRIDAGHHGVSLQNPRVDPCHARAVAASVIQNRIHHFGNDREVALLQAAQHFLHDRHRFVMSSGFFHPRPVFVVDRLPVQAAGLDLPVLIADGGPDFLEGIQIQAARRLSKRGRYCENQRNQTARQHLK